MSSSSREAILAVARRTAQAHGYSGLNFRELRIIASSRSKACGISFDTQSEFESMDKIRNRSDRPKAAHDANARPCNKAPRPSL